MSKFKSLSELSRIVSSCNKRVVLVYGVFDIIHKAHISLFLEAKKCGDILVVGLDHDRNVRFNKGSDRPINKFSARLYVLEQIEPVDYVFKIPAFAETDSINKFYLEICEKISPDAIATKLGSGKFDIYKKNYAEKIGADFLDLGEIYKPNTTDIINQIRNN